jgi:hypothetical protein
VVLEAKELQESNVTRIPAVRSGAELLVIWPEAASYPWTNFAGGLENSDSQSSYEALRALRRFVLAFRSHSKGRLARVEDKIEHKRMTKGILGEKLRQRLIDDRVVYKEGHMYFLDPDALGRETGATYHDLNLMRYNPAVRQYVLSIK